MNQKPKFRKWIIILIEAMLFIPTFLLSAADFSASAGMDTNVAPQVSLSFRSLSSNSPTIQVVYRLPPYTNVEFWVYTNKNLNSWNNMHFRRWPYCMPTNSECGPMILKDSSGHAVPMRIPEINRLSAYPESYSLDEMSQLLRRVSMGTAHHWDAPIKMNAFPALINPADTNEFFYLLVNLNHVFLVETSGDYELTLWPKIYHGSQTNLDLFERIDLPPVKFPITWDARWNTNPMYSPNGMKSQPVF